MKFSDLEINVKKPTALKKQIKNVSVKHDDFTQYSSDSIVYDIAEYSDLLNSIRNNVENLESEVIYGEYDNTNKNIFIRINDYFIDSSKISIKDKSYFFHMLAVMVDAGIPVVQAIKTLSYQTDNKRFKRVLATIGYHCDRGMHLHLAMSRFKNVFDEAEIGVVRAGEATGRLHTMMFRLSKELDKRNDLIMKLWGAASYPIAVFIVLILVSVGMLLWVFPALMKMLEDGGIMVSELPASTKILIAIQSGVVNYWMFIVAFLIGIYLIFTTYINSDYGRIKWDLFKLRIPVVGSFIRKVSVLRFISLLGLLIDAGLPVLTCMQITGDAIPNSIYKIKIQEIIDRVKSGWKISKGMEDTEFLFPSEIVQMVKVGESSASLGNVAKKVSIQYQKEIDNSLKKLSSVFEPVMIMIVGLFVALLALAVMAPIFSLTGSVV